jgi:hypothetical protein
LLFDKLLHSVQKRDENRSKTAGSPHPPAVVLRLTRPARGCSQAGRRREEEEAQISGEQQLSLFLSLPQWFGWFEDGESRGSRRLPFAFAWYKRGQSGYESLFSAHLEK